MIIINYIDLHSVLWEFQENLASSTTISWVPFNNVNWLWTGLSFVYISITFNVSMSINMLKQVSVSKSSCKWWLFIHVSSISKGHVFILEEPVSCIHNMSPSGNCYVLNFFILTLYWRQLVNFLLTTLCTEVACYVATPTDSRLSSTLTFLMSITASITPTLCTILNFCGDIHPIVIVQRKFSSIFSATWAKIIFECSDL